MEPAKSDAVFSGSVAEMYEQYLVPLIFEPYAADLANRLRRLGALQILEVAAGTGVVTRAMSRELSEAVSITATDLNQPMIDHAASLGTHRRVDWRQADVTQLPYDDGRFDAVVCQFGVMFFPDRRAGFAEMRRVLAPGGSLVFNVWDHLGVNEFAEVVSQAAAEVFPMDPPGFLERTPYGYFDADLINGDLDAAGFTVPAEFDVVDARSVAETSEIPAVAFCQGTPLRDEIESRDASRLEEVTAHAAAAIAARFGAADVDGLIRAVVVTARQ